jgi:hypothetical protein
MKLTGASTPHVIRSGRVILQGIVLLDRKNVLDEILRIEGEIAAMRRNPAYLRIKRNLRYLESRRSGPRTFSIAHHDDPEKVVSIRTNSREMKETILRYRERRNDFQSQMDDLCAERERLQEQLFR